MFKHICFFIIILFALVGVFFTGNILHELSHKQDFEGLVYDDSVCILSLPKNISLNNLASESFSSVAFYQYYYNQEDKKEIYEIKEWTEKKAYFFNFLILLVFIICYIIVTFYWVKMNKNSKTKDLNSYYS